MKNITILGWFGSGNVGDDMILLSELNLIKEKYNNSCITVFSGNPNLIEKTFVGIRSEKIPPIMWYRFYRLLNFLYLYRIINIFKKTDLFILGGGGFFSDRQFFAIEGWLRYCKVAKYFGSKVIGFCIGAGPFYSTFNKRLIKNSSKIFDFISVRDNTSLINFRDTGFDKGKLVRMIDPAFFIKSQNVQKDNSIGFIINSHEEYFIGQIRNILDGYDGIIKFIITDDLDINLNKNIVRRLGGNQCKIIIKDNPIDIIKEISSCDFIVSQRLHGSIISFTQRVPFLNIFYHHKGMELIDLLKIKDFSFDVKFIEKYKLLDYISKKDKFVFKDIDLDYFKNELTKLLGKIL